MGKVNLCCNSFCLFVCTTVLAVLATIAETSNWISETQILILIFLLVLPTLYGSEFLYYWFISQRLRIRGWNENSLLRALQLILIMMLFFWVFPLSVLYICLLGK